MDIEKMVREITSEILKEVNSKEKAASSPTGSYDASYGKYMDHTVLKPDTIRNTVKRFCDEAKEYKFASVCVNPTHVKYRSEERRVGKECS